jgi:hypothetical protein
MTRKKVADQQTTTPGPSHPVLKSYADLFSRKNNTGVKIKLVPAIFLSSCLSQSPINNLD